MLISKNKKLSPIIKWKISFCKLLLNYNRNMYICAVIFDHIVLFTFLNANKQSILICVE